MDWEEILIKAIEILNQSYIAIKDWSFGGGTALMYYYNHRKSKDVDIFISNAQLLTMVSPRLNPKASKIADDYIETSEYVKIIIQDQEIDFICAPSLLELKPNLVKIKGYELYIEQPEEIVAKKLYYRPESLKLRDIIDTIIVWKNRENLPNLLKARKLIPPKDILQNRIKALTNNPENVEKTLNSIQLNQPINFNTCLKEFTDFTKILYA